MSEFDAQRVAERIDIVLDILVAGDYHSAIHNLEILLRQVAESTPDIPKAPWEI
ncbi:protein YciZ [Escherichia coli]